MPQPPFWGNLTQQEAISEEGIAAAVAVMPSGRLHRDNAAPGGEVEAAALEREFAEPLRSRFCLALASGGQAPRIAPRAAGVRPGDRVLRNAFTAAPAPGAIAAVGAEPVLAEITGDRVIDLAAKAQVSTFALDGGDVIADHALDAVAAPPPEHVA